MAENIFKFLAFRHQQNVFPRLKSQNQDYISWRGTFNMLERKWLDEQCLWTHLMLSLAPMEILYGTDIAHNK